MYVKRGIENLVYFLCHVYIVIEDGNTVHSVYTLLPDIFFHLVY
jgi:hypothetical protein